MQLDTAVLAAVRPTHARPLGACSQAGGEASTVGGRACHAPGGLGASAVCSTSIVTRDSHGRAASDLGEAGGFCLHVLCAPFVPY